MVAQKLITNSESDIQLSYAKQRRSKSSALLHKELDVRSNRAVRQYLVKVNQAIATLYARHVLASLLADWPKDTALSEEALELNGASHMAYILDMLMQLEEKPLHEKVGGFVFIEIKPPLWCAESRRVDVVFRLNGKCVCIKVIIVNEKTKTRIGKALLFTEIKKNES